MSIIGKGTKEHRSLPPPSMVTLRLMLTSLAAPVLDQGECFSVGTLFDRCCASNKGNVNGNDWKFSFWQRWSGPISFPFSFLRAVVVAAAAAAAAAGGGGAAVAAATAWCC